MNFSIALANRRANPPRRPAALVLAALVLAGCTTTPATRFHSLMPTEVGAPRAASLSPLAVVLEPVRVPAQVDQPQWVVRLADDSVAVLEQERWASSLREELQQALLEALIIGHGLVDARTPGAPGAPPTRIAVDVRRFDSLPGREALIEGSWAIRVGENRSGSRCEWLFREPAAGSFNALAVAHRRAVARLGEAIGDAVVKGGRGEAAVCPAREERK